MAETRFASLACTAAPRCLRARVTSALLASLLIAPPIACSSEATIDERVVTLHVPRACALGASANGVLYARGDFEPTPDAPAQERRLRLADVGPLASIPPATRSLTVEAGDAEDPDASWLGEASVPVKGAVDVLLWRSGTPCLLSEGLGAREGTALHVFDGRHALIAGGRSASGVPASYVADLGTGIVTALPVGMLRARVAPSITSFGAGALVAGGLSAQDGSALDTAEVYAAASADFDGASVLIGEPRAAHAAVLLVSGETLLVGGTGASGAPLGSLVVIDPATRRARTQGLTQLAVARTKPTVLRLASGEILVAGGFDAAGMPIPTLEWLTPDARAAAKRPRDLVATREHDFVALPGGGALAVLVPERAVPGFKNVWVIRADGGLEDATPLADLTVARLFPGTEGAPVLYTGTGWMRWRPWEGAFSAYERARSPEGPVTDVIAAGDPGLGLWLTGNGGETRLTGFRFATRGPYVAHPEPLASSATIDPQRRTPRFLAPDRLVLGAQARSISFDERLGLTLEPDATVFVTDATFPSVEIIMAIPTGQPPLVVLRDERGAEMIAGGVSCSVPAAAAAEDGVATRLRVVRAGASLRVQLGDGPELSCGGPRETARVAVGLRGAPSQPRSVFHSLQLTRRGPRG